MRAAVCAILGVLAAAPQATDLNLQDLTLPAAERPAGCVLPDKPSATIDGTPTRVLVGLWAGLPIAPNPWTGSDRPVIMTILDRLDTSPLPDGPPLTRGQMARYRSQQADSVAQGYAAVYRQADGSLIVVYALTFADADRANAAAPTLVHGGRHFVTDRTIVVANGASGPCGGAIWSHVKKVVGLQELR